MMHHLLTSIYATKKFFERKILKCNRSGRYHTLSYVSTILSIAQINNSARIQVVYAYVRYNNQLHQCLNRLQVNLAKTN